MTGKAIFIHLLTLSYMPWFRQSNAKWIKYKYSTAALLAEHRGYENAKQTKLGCTHNYLILESWMTYKPKKQMFDSSSLKL